MENEASHQRPKRMKPTKTKHAQSSSASTQDSILTLPSELITEILLRLPVKTLLQFRSVSKSWLALISSPQFVKAHLSESVNNKDYTHQRLMLNFIRRKKNSLKVCSIRSLLNESVMESSDLDCPLKTHFGIVGSVNGLICLAVAAEDFFLWNPSIRKFKKVTALKAPPRCGCHIFGFGYDELHDDYKLVSIFYTISGGYTGDVKVEIYSLKSDSWRRIDGFQGGVIHSGLAKLVNGKLHWVTTGGHPWCYDGDIISIDLADEKYGKLEPPCYGEGDYCLKLGVLGSDLSMFCNYERTCTDVWVMKEYGVKESWAKIYTISFSHGIPKHVSSPLFRKSNKGEVLLVFGTRCMMYNPKDDSMRYLKVANFNSCFAANFYVESLVFPFANEPTTQQ